MGGTGSGWSTQTLTSQLLLLSIHHLGMEGKKDYSYILNSFVHSEEDLYPDKQLCLVSDYFCVDRMMYWTDWGRKPRIESAWMDGQHREVLVKEEDLGWPTGLALDYLNGNRIYWCDSKENVIESMKPDGTDRKIVISGGQNTDSLLKNKTVLWCFIKYFIRQWRRFTIFCFLIGFRHWSALQSGSVWGACLLDNKRERWSVEDQQVWERT